MRTEEWLRWELSFRPVDEGTARTIHSWRYEGRYAVYNSDPASFATDLQSLLTPENAYYGVWDNRGRLVAYRCFGPAAQVPGGEYSDPALDTGGGLCPDLMGQGLGHKVVKAGIEFGRYVFSPVAFRVTIAGWNTRALSIYWKIGFDHKQTFETGDGRVFQVLVKEEDPTTPTTSLET